MTPEERLLAAIFGAPCDGTAECPAPIHQFPCEAASANPTPPAASTAEPPAPAPDDTGLSIWRFSPVEPTAERGDVTTRDPLPEGTRIVYTRSDGSEVELTVGSTIRNDDDTYTTQFVLPSAAEDDQ